jgi:hypothetical protein
MRLEISPAAWRAGSRAPKTTERSWRFRRSVKAMSDPTRVTDQTALTTSSGRSWLVVGALLAALSLGFLFAMRDLEPAGVSAAGIVTIVVLYLAMIAVRFGIARLRLRLGLLAALTIGICVAFVVCALFIAWAEWGTLASSAPR